MVVFECFLLLESSITLKRKVSPNESCSTVSSQVQPKRVKTVGYVSARDHARVASQLAASHEENLLYKATWMRMFDF